MQVKVDEIARIDTNNKYKVQECEALERKNRQSSERFEIENKEIRNLLQQESAKALEAAREAQRFEMEIHMHKERADKATLDLNIQKSQITELQNKLMET